MKTIKTFNEFINENKSLTKSFLFENKKVLDGVNIISSTLNIEMDEMDVTEIAGIEVMMFQPYSNESNHWAFKGQYKYITPDVYFFFDENGMVGVMYSDEIIEIPGVHSGSDMKKILRDVPVFVEPALITLKVFKDILNNL